MINHSSCILSSDRFPARFRNIYSFYCQEEFEEHYEQQLLYMISVIIVQEQNDQYREPLLLYMISVLIVHEQFDQPWTTTSVISVLIGCQELFDQPWITTSVISVLIGFQEQFDQPWTK
jgi:hypothetical protein